MDIIALIASVTVMGAIVCAMMAVYQTTATPRSSLQRRLGSLLGDASALELTAMAGQALRLPKTGKVPIISGLINGRNWTADVALKLERAELKLTVSEYVAMRILVGLLLALAPVLLLGGIIGLLLGAVVFVVGFTLPSIYVGMKLKGRIKKLENQLTDALTLVSNSIKAGFGLMQSLDLAARELPHPISTEFRRTLYDMNVGSTSEEALAAMSKRCGSRDIDIIITAMLIQQSTGGNLSEILDNVAHTLRERIRIRGEINTLTTQQMLSGFIVGGLPIAMAVAFSVMSPGYLHPLISTPIGYVLIAGGIVLEVFGCVVIKKILSIEV